MSDHSLLVAELNFRRPKPPIVTYCYRDLKHMDYAAFQNKLGNCSIITSPPENVDQYVAVLNTELNSLLDEFCPLKAGRRPNAAKSRRWLSPEAVEAKRTRRRLERRWRKTSLEIDRIAYRTACRHANKLILQSRSATSLSLLADVAGNSRKTWASVKNLLHTQSQSSEIHNAPTFVHALSASFVKKISDIKSAIGARQAIVETTPFFGDVTHTGELLRFFQPVTIPEVAALLRSIPAKSSPTDVVATSVMKACADIFSVIITSLANKCIDQGVFPSNFKHAQITPIIKKAGLNPDDPANYRPISNLNSISKILERLILNRLLPHIANSQNFHEFQSAYRRFHSTETALCKITDDIYSQLDNGSVCALIALDMSAAFDTIDHQILSQRLNNTFGIRDKALDLISSYLSDRTSTVKIANSSSDTTAMPYGVPQGSVLGPVLFLLYVAPLYNVVRSAATGSHSQILFHQYADDTQLYLPIPRLQCSSHLELLESCTESIFVWLTANGLALNPSKSESIIFFNPHSKPQRDLANSLSCMTVAGTRVTVSASIKNLGVILDNRLSFDNQVSAVCKSCFFHLRALRKIRASITLDIAKTVACSIVSTRLDYCNALYAGLSATNLSRLQRIQNAAARIVTQSSRRSHASPILSDLHWLPVRARINFKLATLTYKTLASGKPNYLNNLLIPYIPKRQLRSAFSSKLAVPCRKSAMAQSKSFSSSAVSVWNSLPHSVTSAGDLKTFRTLLKTHLFTDRQID